MVGFEKQSFPVLEAGTGSKIVIMLHGVFSNMHESGRFDRQSELHVSNGYRTARFDHQAHGDRNTQSQTFRIPNMIRDFYDVYKRFEGMSEINLVASSFGASIFLIASHCFKDMQFRRVVLLNPVTDYKTLLLKPITPQMQCVFSDSFWEEVNQNGSREALNGIVFDQYNYVEFSILEPKRYIGELGENTLVIHGTDDTAVSYEECKENFLQNSAVSFEPIKGADHAFTDEKSESTSFKLIKSWIGRGN